MLQKWRFSGTSKNITTVLTYQNVELAQGQTG